jgi:hypothetical protein
MNAPLEFKVGFGRSARTLVYEDPEGSIWFAFDITPAKDQTKGKWNLHLGRQPLTPEGKEMECATVAERERTVAALARVKEHAASKGYLVELS